MTPLVLFRVRRPARPLGRLPEGLRVLFKGKPREQARPLGRLPDGLLVLFKAMPQEPEHKTPAAPEFYYRLDLSNFPLDGHPSAWDRHRQRVRSMGHRNLLRHLYG